LPNDRKPDFRVLRKITPPDIADRLPSGKARPAMLDH